MGDTPQPVLVPPLSDALIERAMPNGIPWTIHRLRTLKPNESFCYYTGNLTHDIERSCVWAPHYHDLLEKIRQTVEDLERQHRISSEATRGRIHGREYCGIVSMYYATGIRQS